MRNSLSIKRSNEHRGVSLWIGRGSKALLTAAVICGLFHARESRAAQEPAENLIDKPVAEFAFPAHPDGSGHWFGDAAKVGVPEAASALAQHTESKIAIEFLPFDLPVVPVAIHVKDSTVGTVLSSLLDQDPRYEFVVRPGLIEVRPKGSEDDPVSCLNMEISEYQVAYNWFYAFVGLELKVEHLREYPDDDDFDPIARIRGGYSGAGPGLCAPQKVVEASFEKATVRQILNALAASSGNIAWTARFKSSPRACENMIWSNYQPAGCYPLFEGVVDSVEGLPPRCRKCHYHKK